MGPQLRPLLSFSPVKRDLTGLCFPHTLCSRHARTPKLSLKLGLPKRPNAPSKRNLPSMIWGSLADLRHIRDLRGTGLSG